MLKSVRNRQSDALACLSWQDFERLLADYYRDLGYQVEHHGTGSNNSRSDGGIDLKLRKNGEYMLVQCKHWNAMQVPHNDVHQLMGIMDNEDATGAILVTSGEFTAAAIQAAGKKGRVQLIDGVALRTLLGARLPPDPPPPTIPGADNQFSWNSVPTGDRYPRHHSRARARSGTQGKMALIGAAMVFALLLFYVAYRLVQSALDSLAPTAKPVPVEVAQPVTTPRYSLSGQDKLETAGHPVDPAKLAAQIVALQAAAVTRDQYTADRAFSASHQQLLRSIKLADTTRQVDREHARVAAKQVSGVRSAVWIDRENLLLIVEENRFRSYDTIDKVCIGLQPLGDTLGVVINVQSGAARTGDELAVLSRNCQLEPGDRAFMQKNRQVDVVGADVRAEHRANNPEANTKVRQTNAESMKILERTTPALKD